MSSLVTEQDFKDALETTRHCQANDYSLFAQSLGHANIKSRQEAAVYLAHVIHETGNLESMVEIDHEKNKNDYNCKADGQEWERKWAKYNRPGKYYYGRGCLQLSWTCNYYLASKDIFGDENRLLDDPDQIVSNRELCWRTAAWFWKTNVHGKASSMNIHDTTNIINSMEITDPSCKKYLDHRQLVYTRIANKWRL